MATRTAALTLLLPAAGAEVQLLPAGLFRAADGSGRPEGVPGWKIDAEIAGRIIAAAAARSAKFVIDYEHQTFLAEKNGQPAPAAGWFDGRGLEWREGVGLFATQVEWTERARNMIADREYRYLSPTFTWDDETGDVRMLVNAGLTNNPGLDGMAAVALSALFHSPEEEHPVNETLKKLLAALGLTDTASEADALAGVAALKARADQHTAELATLRAATPKTPAAPDPARFVPVEAVQQMQGQLAALTAKLDNRERDALIEAGIADGRLNPALQDWAKGQSVASLTAFLASAQPIAALAGMQTGGKQPTGGQAQKLTEGELAVCRAMGISADDFLKSKGA